MFKSYFSSRTTVSRLRISTTNHTTLNGWFHLHNHSFGHTKYEADFFAQVYW